MVISLQCRQSGSYLKLSHINFKHENACLAQMSTHHNHEIWKNTTSAHQTR